jgi:thioredoxin-related protein
MKKKVSIFIIFIFASLAILFINGYLDKTKREKQNKSIYSLNENNWVNICGSELVSTKQCKGITALIFYDPGCTHCDSIASQIRQKKDILSNIHFIMISSNNSEMINLFKKRHNLSDFENIKWIIDSTKTLNRSYGFPVTPTLFVYRDGIFVQKFNGEVKLESAINK